MKRSQPKRDWSEAEAKRGDGCRVCPQGSAELAHITARANDKFYAMDDPGLGAIEAGRQRRNQRQLRVSPLRVVPLCRECHAEYDDHKLDLTTFLTAEEAAQAVLDVGFENARIRVSGQREQAA